MKLFVGTKAIIHHNKKLLLLRESSLYIDGAERGKWDVPGGRIESHETVTEGLIREVKEECGLEISPGKLLGVFDGFPVIREEECHVVRMYFLCEAKTDEITLSQDHDSYDWVDPDAIGDKILMNDIAEMIQAGKENL